MVDGTIVDKYFMKYFENENYMKLFNKTNTDLFYKIENKYWVVLQLFLFIFIFIIECI